MAQIEGFSLRNPFNLVIRLGVKYGSNDLRIRILRRYYGVVIGESCEIFPDVTWGSEPYLIEVGDRTRITNGVKFVTHDGGLWTLRKTGLIESDSCVYGRIYIGDDVHIGWNTIIMPNVRIGNRVVIGCGSVVTKDVPDDSVVAGVPAKLVRTLDEYAARIQVRAVRLLNLSPSERRTFLEGKA